MKLYRVYRTDNVGWDEYDSFIVRAENEERALELCLEAEYGDKNFIKDNVVFVELTVEGTEGIILGSFNAG